MKARAYIRVAKDGGRHKLVANVKPNHGPLTRGDGTPLPTVAFSVVFEIPDGMFRQAEQIIATLTISESQASIAAEVTEHA